METAAKNRLKQYIEDYIPVDDLKKAGFFGKGVKKTDYEKIAERICWFFGYKTIYEYKLVCKGKDCDGDNCDGRNKFCKNYKMDQPINWPAMKVVDQSEIASQDNWLN